MPRRKTRTAAVVPDPAIPTEPALPDDNFVDSLKADLARTQKASLPKPDEDLGRRAELNRRLLQDLWEVHNQFEESSVHLTVDPSQTLFATFVDYPTKWTFKENFDFAAVKTIELRDRMPGWVGFTLRFWYYPTPEGKPHLRGVFEWCEGETYHRYTGWMRMMTQAVLYDAPDPQVNMRSIHQVLRDVVVAWFSAHLDRAPEKFTEHLKGKYPRGASFTKETYRE
ncbi:MAG: hypothetical protein L3J87_05375 [Thermoplasmata archaeon]|nr:hypothetical protein [Thermoplasmata archaeon]